MWGFWRRHKRKVFVTVGVFGSGYLLYKLYDAQTRRLRDLEKQLADERESGELMKAQIQAHLESVQRIADSTALPLPPEILHTVIVIGKEQLVLRGTMRAHTDRITAIAIPIDNSDMIVTSSCDKSVILWAITKEDRTYGVARRHLTGHSHFVQDVVLSSDGRFALSGSQDGELRLWDLQSGVTVRRFVGHTKGVLSVAFSVDSRQIVSASRDKTIKLWNTLGECKYTIQDQDAHSGWVSCVRFSPNNLQPTIVSGSRDKTVKIWNLSNRKLRSTLTGHTGYVNTVAVSPEGSLCASGGKDGVILLWDLAEGERLYSLDAGSIIHALCFSPNRYWLCAATAASIKIWDLESKSVVVDLKVDLKQESELAADGAGQTAARKSKVIFCTSLNWSADGSTLFSGYTDGVVRVWGIGHY